jgi:uncharacterized membrane-anchored protein
VRQRTLKTAFIQQNRGGSDFIPPITVLFWAAFILSRPLGATVGDFLDKPVASGGLAMSRYSASAALAIFMLGCIFLFRQNAERIRVG